MRPVTIAAAVALACAAGAAGCGGDDGSGAEATTAPTATVAKDARLSQASWQTYLKARTRAQAVNATATKKFRACRSLIEADTDPQEVQSCLGDTPTKVVSEGQQLIATLDGFQDETGGACADAGTALSGYVNSYVATINAVNDAIDRGNVTFVQQQLDEAARALAGARASRAPFEAACRPAG